LNNDYVLITTIGAEELSEVDNVTNEDYFYVKAYFQVLECIMKKQLYIESWKMA